MAPQAYAIKRNVALAASGSGILSIFVSPGLTLHLRHWLWTSTSTFNLVDIVVNNATHLLDASVSVPVLSTFLQVLGSPNFNYRDFDGEITVPGNSTVNIAVIDTSAAPNTVQLFAWGEQDYP